MTTLLSNFSIKSRIYFGFIAISSFILLVCIISVQASYRIVSNFNQYDLGNERAFVILRIDSDVANLKRGVQEFVSTGYEGVSEKVSADIEGLKVSFNMVRPLFFGDPVAENYIRQMEQHFGKYSQTFLFAAEEIKNRQQFLMNVGQSLASLMAAPELTETDKNIMIKLENNLYVYLNDPDILLIDSSLDILDEKIDEMRIGVKEKMLAYKKDYVDVVQSTRGYLFLISVVMAGEAQEFKYFSTQLKNLALDQTVPIKVNFENVISQAYTILLVSTFILILLAFILSYTISRSISLPLRKLTETFGLLADNKDVENVPGQNYKDEIGIMSRAAEVFRVNNVRTKQLVVELDQERSKLKISNKELEQFAYIASHDLQEPLRTLSSFIVLLNNEYKDNLGQKGRDYLRFISEASARMRLLIQGVLEYSQIGKTGDFGTINLNFLVHGVLSDLGVAIKEKGAQIYVSELPDLYGTELEYRSLYTNLISNALKFIKPGSIPEIEIGFNNDGDKNVFFVKDKGIGIDPLHKHKVFMIFQRMHDRSYYSGSGIGLAHCKKIVEAHHGNIWLESELDKGCTFFFTLGDN